MDDLLLSDVALPGGAKADVLIRNGVIAKIAARIQDADITRLSGDGKLLLPAGIDFHVHFRTPGATYKESLFTGARAAVKGGIATCGDMPNTNPPTATLEHLEAKASLAADVPAHVYCHFGAEPDNLKQVRQAASHPSCKAIKIFIGPSTGHGGLAPASVEQHFKVAAEVGLPVIVHAEDVDLIAGAQSHYPHDARHHTDLRPVAAELSAVRVALDLARRYPVRLCIAHSTTAEVVRLADASGIRDRIFIEVTPHHLLLSTDDIVPPTDNRYKVNPPIRPEGVRAALAELLVKGIDGLGSDHAPHTLSEKQQPYDGAPSGIPGVEYQVPLAITWWREGRITLERLIDLTSGSVSRFFGLNKGRIAEGADADLILVDPQATWTIGEGDDRVASRCGYTLYQGRSMRGRVEATIVAGHIAWTRSRGWHDSVPARWATEPTPGSGGHSSTHVRQAPPDREPCCD